MNGDLFAEPASNLIGSGQLDKMLVKVDSDQKISYQLQFNDQLIDMNALIGSTLEFQFDGQIFCCFCGKQTPKSYQGYCYDHFMSLAQCDTCMMSPERCHLAKGTCREPEWAETVCQQPHYVYLANSSGIKVGITRAGQLPVRWIDQGAEQAIIIARVSSRLLSGLLEVIFKQHVADKTNWRTMLKGTTEDINLAEQRDLLFSNCAASLQTIEEKYGRQHIQLIRQGEQQQFQYPVVEYPEKVVSMNFDKQNRIGGKLLGIKGQYLIFDQGVVNIRRHSGYQVQLFASAT